MRYSKFRFWIVFFGIGVIFFAAGGGGAFAGGNSQIDKINKAWDLLEQQGELDEASKAEVQKFFLDKNVKANESDKYGRTPLHAAAVLGDSALAAFLIEQGTDQGADVDPVAKTREEIEADEAAAPTGKPLPLGIDKVAGKTPLMIAAEKVDSKVASVLVKGGANIHKPLGGGGTVADRALKEPDFLKAILTPESVKSTDEKGKTILHLAVEKGYTESIKIILAAGAPVDQKDKFGKTILHLAADKGYAENIKIILAADPPPQVNEKDNSGKTALDLALSHTDDIKYAEAAALIIRKGGTSTNPAYGYFEPAVRTDNYNIRFTYDFTPLHYAARDGNIALVTYLLNNDAGFNAKNASGATPLHEAARENQVNVMKELIAKGADINNLDAYGNSVLHTAIPWKDAVILLLKEGADPNLPDSHGDSPLHIAITLNRKDVVEILLKDGADVSIKNRDGKTPLYLAVEKNRSACIPLLLQNNSDFFAGDNDGVTPFEKALDGGSPEEVLEAMITKESVLQQIDSGGNTVLHIAVKSGANEKTIGLILDRGALVNATNNEGDTSLHLAARYNRKEEIAELLLRRGANLFALNGRGESPLSLLFAGRNTETGVDAQR